MGLCQVLGVVAASASRRPVDRSGSDFDEPPVVPAVGARVQFPGFGVQGHGDTFRGQSTARRRSAVPDVVPGPAVVGCVVVTSLTRPENQAVVPSAAWFPTPTGWRALRSGRWAASRSAAADRWASVSLRLGLIRTLSLGCALRALALDRPQNLDTSLGRRRRNTSRGVGRHRRTRGDYWGERGGRLRGRTTHHFRAAG